MNPFIEGLLKVLGQKAGEAVSSRLSGQSKSRDSSQASTELDAIFMRGLEKYDSEPYVAVQYFKAGAERGHPPSQCYLGLCLRDGHGCLEDEEEGNKWVELAARSGDDLAIKILAHHRLFSDFDNVMEEGNRALDETNRFLSKSTKEQLREILGDDPILEHIKDDDEEDDDEDDQDDDDGETEEDQLRYRIRRIVAAELEVQVSEVDDLTDFVEELGADGRHGRNMKNIYSEIEDAFGINIPWTDEAKMLRKQIWDLDDLCEYVEKKIAKKGRKGG
jgi:acyl carrier protein